MAETHGYKTTIILCGIEVEVDVDFTIHSWGAPATWFDPAESAELEIDRVTAIDTQLNLDHVLNYRDLWAKPDYRGEYPTICETIENEIHENLHDYDSGGWDD